MKQAGPGTAEDERRLIWTDRLRSLQRDYTSSRPIFGNLGLAGDSLAAGDYAGACRSAVRALGDIARLEGDYRAYWALIDEAYAAAEKARGVTPA